MILYSVTADLHFDLFARLSTLTPSGLTTRLLDVLACWEWIVKTSVKRGCKELFVLGDIFNSRTSLDVPVLDAACRAFKSASSKIDLHILVGNHDSFLRSPELNTLQVFRGYANVYEEPLAYPPFVLVPWTEKPEDFVAGVDKAIGKNTPFLLGHVLLEEAGYPGKGLPLAALKPKRFKQILLGDVHDPKIIAGNARYVGSPLQIDFRDAGCVRGFYLLDTVKDRVEFVRNTVSPRFHILSDPDVSDVRKQDFVRVKTDNAKIALATIKAAQKVTPWVESTFVETADTAPRIEVHAKDTQEAVLRRYSEFVGAKDVDSLVKLGLEILEEARS